MRREIESPLFAEDFLSHSDIFLALLEIEVTTEVIEDITEETIIADISPPCFNASAIFSEEEEEALKMLIGATGIADQDLVQDHVQDQDHVLQGEKEVFISSRSVP